MLGTQEENFQILIRLGLTVSQAKVYLALLKLGQTNGKMIAQHSKVARQEVYRILAELREKGLVEKVISVPAVFKPLPIEDCLDILVKRKKDDLLEVEKKLTSLLQQTKNTAGTAQEEEPQLVLVPKKEASRRRLSKAIENTQVSCDMILHWECFRYGMIEDTETWRKAVEKGAKIRFIVYKPKKEKAVSQIVQTFKKKGSFKVKYVFTRPPATIAIFDSKETIITLSPTPHPREAHNLWTNNPGLISIFQDYFELVWRTSSENKHKKTLSDL